MTFKQHHGIVNFHLIHFINSKSQKKTDDAKEFDITRKTIWIICKCAKDAIHLGNVYCYLHSRKVGNVGCKRLEAMKKITLKPWGTL